MAIFNSYVSLPEGSEDEDEEDDNGGGNDANNIIEAQ
jgi:hypothetical protein